MTKHIDSIMAVQNEIAHITCAEAVDYRGRSDVLFVDVRNKEAFLAGHIPNALHCDRGILEFLVADGSPMQIEVFKQQTFAHCIVYCNGGKQSILATKTLQDMGIQCVKNLRGGYTEWISMQDDNA